MERIDDPTINNPYGWRLADLADPATPLSRRRQLHDELLVWEALEIAHGYRHLTVAHGAGDTIDACRTLDDFYDRVCGVLGDRWARVRGTGDYVTITVIGPHAETDLATIANLAEQLSGGAWRVVPGPVPPLVG